MIRSQLAGTKCVGVVYGGIHTQQNYVVTLILLLSLVSVMSYHSNSTVAKDVVYWVTCIDISYTSESKYMYRI